MPGARSSARTSPVMISDDSCVSLLAISNSSGVMSFLKATHWAMPAAVAQLDELQTAFVGAVVNPAAYGHFLTDMLGDFGQS